MAVCCFTKWLAWNGRHVCKNALEYDIPLSFFDMEYFFLKLSFVYKFCLN